MATMAAVLRAACGVGGEAEPGVQERRRWSWWDLLMDWMWNRESQEPRVTPGLSAWTVKRMELPLTEMGSPCGSGSLEGDGGTLQTAGLTHVGAGEATQAHLGYMWGHHRSLEVREVSGEPGKVSAGVRG